MTPWERRAKYPIAPATPLTDDELEKLRQKTEHWLQAPDFTSRELDRVYTTYARLIETIDEAREPR